MKAFPDLRFLVAEDHGFQRWLIANLLEGLGAQSVSTAGGGAEALSMLASKTEEIDVVVSDLDMPGMDGMELIRRMAEHNHRAALIVVSAVQPAVLRTVETMAIAYGINFVAAVRKPLNSKKLRDAIALLDEASPARPRPSIPLTLLEIEEAARRGQFEPFFQPKVEIKGRKICGAEALARWRHPGRGFIPPNAFLGLIESTPLIDTVTRSVVETAIRHCRAWRDAGLELTVSVNLSSVSLSDTGFADWMTNVAKDEGVKPTDIICEVTETAAMNDLGRTLETLSRLSIRGFALSIDDYGTGYSSMERLSSIPFTELKIDQSFVRKATSDPASRAIIESSIELAAKLQITTVAEGVEGQGEWDFLHGQGCALAQGYYIARPMEGAQFLEWIRARPAGQRLIGATR